ncbi:helix-turn-helix transcriptional regulator [Paraburkholderia caffeinitolerans]|uniref:helix-turn-helix transcriptional regulator n=1 Tax=Paraburkholderia caffeinitolerans TaxID=1723730 RepID=UPI00158443D8|nr:AAA family ATPase [Paraburkholderia caffeinitolerans]
MACAVQQEAARTPVIGREAELGALAGLVGHMIDGHGAIAMLAGEPGIGKTHTAQALASRATHGVRVLWGRCNEQPGAPPYWPWLQIMRAWLAGRDEETLRAVPVSTVAPIAEIFPEIRQRIVDLAPLLPTPDPQQQRFRLFDAWTGFWKFAAATEPLLLIIDNLHWADASSLGFLEFLAPEVADHRILLLATYRDVELDRQHPLSATLGDLARYAHFHRFHLAGFDRRETEAMVALSGGKGIAPRLLDTIHSQTEGNPLFIAETIRLLIQEGTLEHGMARPPTEPHPAAPCVRIPEGVKQIIGRRLDHLSPPTNRVLERAALIGRIFELRLLRYLLDEALAIHFNDAIEEALRSRILEPGEQPGCFQFSHALIRETLYDEIPMLTRCALHLQVARTIEEFDSDDSGQHLSVLAHHYASALPVADAARATDVARCAAERATRLLAHEEAVRYYRLALQAASMTSPDDPVSRIRLLNALGESLTLLGDYLQARETFGQAMSLARVARQADEMMRAAMGFEMATWSPGLPGQSAAQLLREALAAQDGGNSPARAKLLSALARALIFSGDETQAAIVRDQALAIARRSGDKTALASTLASALSIRWQPERSGERLRDIGEALDLAQGTDNLLLALDVKAWELFETMELGDLSTWLMQLAQLERQADELRQPFMRYVAATSRATCALLQGRFKDAEHLIAQALQIGRRMPGLDAPGVYGMQMFTLRCEQGRLRELTPLVQAFVRAMPRAGLWRPGLALLYAEIGLLDEARCEFEALAADAFSAIRHDALRAASLAYLAQVCARLDDKPHADVLYALLLPYAGRNLLIGTTVGCFGAAASLLGLLATTQRNWQEAQRHFESALTMNLRQGAEPALARTRLRYASMRLARNADGDIDAARVLLEDAHAAAERMGMGALTREIDSAQRSIEPASSRAWPAGLSTRETEVLRLVSSGLGNREIAEQLFVSPNTIANHIRAILTKTNSANRTEAAAFAVRNGLTDV